MAEDNTQLLHDMAKLYYMDDMTQAKIAARYNLSRPTVSRLLAEAKSRGIVKIIISNPSEDMHSVETRIKECFGLRAVKVVPVPTDDHDLALQVTAREAARFFVDFFEPNDKIGLDWGRTIHEVSRNLPPLPLSGCQVVQLCGNLDNADALTYATEIVSNFALKLGTKAAFTLPYPVIVDSGIIFDILMHDEKVRQNMDLAESCNKMVVNLGVPKEDNCLYKSGYLKPVDLAVLRSKVAVGSICCHYFDDAGNICDEQLDKRTVSVGFETIKKADLVLSCICGSYKSQALYSALRAGLIDVLVTDSVTASTVLQTASATEE